MAESTICNSIQNPVLAGYPPNVPDIELPVLVVLIAVAALSVAPLSSNVPELYKVEPCKERGLEECP
jgi:hypothetical protein